MAGQPHDHIHCRGIDPRDGKAHSQAKVRCAAHFANFPCYSQQYRACFNRQGTEAVEDPMAVVMFHGHKICEAALKLVGRIIGTSPKPIKAETEAEIAAIINNCVPTMAPGVPSGIAGLGERGPLGRYYTPSTILGYGTTLAQAVGTLRRQGQGVRRRTQRHKRERRRRKRIHKKTSHRHHRGRRKRRRSRAKRDRSWTKRQKRVNRKGRGPPSWAVHGPYAGPPAHGPPDWAIYGPYAGPPSHGPPDWAVHGPAVGPPGYSPSPSPSVDSGEESQGLTPQSASPPSTPSPEDSPMDTPRAYKILYGHLPRSKKRKSAKTKTKSRKKSTPKTRKKTPSPDESPVELLISG